ncbi:ABC-2 type transporter [Methanoregula boonei 6A8]|jgi:lipopolysaccharide transport system permease protein|uniref:ABC-2 type transporter n=1 Tax=Methanoregula boonei (strain DSM 21154 / JCM 14090 / 6A8) TaxID=456442 RepID=A7I966_METB6|nr:ABC transporter permease [Methanoregula boonei]ABS56277.1 ABC-2 type transporter [Methanoregula boonei 6A8]
MTETSPAPEVTLPTLVIRPPRKWVPVDLKELWAYRELIAAFTMRDVKLRYKQTGLGIAWAVLQPLLTMIIFTVVFGGLAHLPSDGVPYPLFVLAALLPWMLFAEGLTRSTTTMVTNSSIMTKVYFPRLIMPLSSILSPLVDFGVSFIILIAMMVYYGFVPTFNIVFLPLFVLLALATSLGVGLWLSALNVRYRDFQYTVPFLIQIWMFASPVVYASSLVPESLRVWYGLNPMAGVIEGFRWALLGSGTPSAMILVSVGMVILLLVSGMFYFRRMEQYYADIV